MTKYYLACDIKDSTKMWRHKETEMLHAFLIEWYIICMFLKELKDQMNIDSKVLGQYGDEWHIQLSTNHDSKYVIRKLLFLVFVLKQFAERPILNLKSMSKKSNLFRFGFSENSVEEAMKHESECDLDRICVKKKMKSFFDHTNLDTQEQTTLENIQEQLIKFNPFDNVDKCWCYYVFADKNVSSKSHIKTKKLKDRVMVSYKCNTLKEFMKLVDTLDKTDTSYCAVHGEVHAINPSSLLIKNLCFLNPKDVYGDTVNRCAKEFISMLLSKDDKGKQRFTKIL